VKQGNSDSNLLIVDDFIPSVKFMRYGCSVKSIGYDSYASCLYFVFLVILIYARSLCNTNICGSLYFAMPNISQ